MDTPLLPGPMDGAAGNKGDTFQPTESRHAKHTIENREGMEQPVYPYKFIVSLFGFQRQQFSNLWELLSSIYVELCFR